MEPTLDLDMEVNDVKDYDKSEQFEDKNDFIDTGANDKKRKHLNSDGLAIRYKHIEEFFIYESSETKENGITDMKFSCVNCDQHGHGKKVLKTSSQAPTSNLKKHLSLKHTNSMSRFLAILESTPRKSRQKNQTKVKDEVVFEKSTIDFDFAAKYAHMEEFFKFQSSKDRNNGFFDMEFSCTKCLPVGKVIKTSTQAPMSNLKAHLRKVHADFICHFDEIIEINKEVTKLMKPTKVQKITQKSIENNIEQSNESSFEEYTPDFDMEEMEVNDVKDPRFCVKSEQFDDKNDLIGTGADDKKVKLNGVPSSDFATKYAHLEEFFKFESSKRRNNGIFDMEFSCTKCLPVVKVLKTSTQAPMSNLRAHLKKVHADFMNQFDEITKLAKSYKLRKTTQKSIENKAETNIEQSNEVFLEEEKEQHLEGEQEQHDDSHNNPWSVNSIYDFSYFCCPECEDSKWEFKQDFVNHALSTHPNSIVPIQNEINDGSLNDIVLPDATSPIIQFKV